MQKVASSRVFGHMASGFHDLPNYLKNNVCVVCVLCVCVRVWCVCFRLFHFCIQTVCVLCVCVCVVKNVCYAQ